MHSLKDFITLETDSELIKTFYFIVSSSSFLHLSPNAINVNIKAAIASKKYANS
jgi:hypothetical protein